jgi:hypothetical protein
VGHQFPQRFERDHCADDNGHNPRPILHSDVRPHLWE